MNVTEKEGLSIATLHQCVNLKKSFGKMLYRFETLERPCLRMTKHTEKTFESETELTFALCDHLIYISSYSFCNLPLITNDRAFVFISSALLIAITNNNEFKSRLI